MSEQEDHQQGSQPPPSRPLRPARPEAPVPRAPAPEPAYDPAEATPSEAHDEIPPGSEIYDDDDMIAIPAPSPEVFAPKPAPRARQPEALAGLRLRRTLIPILLTFGVALPLVGCWWFWLGADSPLKSAGLAFPITVFVVGLVLLLFAVLNMMQVNSMLQRQQTDRSDTTPR